MLSMLFPRLCSRTLSLIEMNLLGGGQQSGLMALAFILLTHFGDTIPKDINQTLFYSTNCFHFTRTTQPTREKMTTDVKSEISQENLLENVLMC